MIRLQPNIMDDDEIRHYHRLAKFSHHLKNCVFCNHETEDIIIVKSNENDITDILSHEHIHLLLRRMGEEEANIKFDKVRLV